MLTQVDSDDMSTTLMETIVDHRRDDEKALQLAEDVVLCVHNTTSALNR